MPDANLDRVVAEHQADALGRLWRAIVDNTRGDLFWIGEVLLDELRRETGYSNTGAQMEPAIDSSEVAVAAAAMREKRRELIDQPLAMIFVQLARAGLEAAARYRSVEQSAQEKSDGVG